MAAAYYGADAATANAIGTSAAAAASAMVAEFAVGAITGAAGVQSPFSSISNAIGGSMGSTIREDSDWKEK